MSNFGKYSSNQSCEGSDLFSSLPVDSFEIDLESVDCIETIVLPNKITGLIHYRSKYFLRLNHPPYNEKNKNYS